MVSPPTTQGAETGCGHPNHGASDHDCAPFRRAWDIDRDGTCDGCSEGKRLVRAYDVDDHNEPHLCADCAKGNDALGRLADGMPVHYFDCERFNVTDYGSRQGRCDCTATDDLRAVLANA